MAMEGRVRLREKQRADGSVFMSKRDRKALARFVQTLDQGVAHGREIGHGGAMSLGSGAVEPLRSGDLEVAEAVAGQRLPEREVGVSREPEEQQCAGHCGRQPQAGEHGPPRRLP